MGVDRNHCSQTSVLEAQLPIVLRKHHAIARGEHPLQALDSERAVITRHLAPGLDVHFVPQLAPLLQDRTSPPIQLRYIGSRVREDEAALLRLRVNVTELNSLILAHTRAD